MYIITEQNIIFVIASKQITSARNDTNIYFDIGLILMDINMIYNIVCVMYDVDVGSMARQMRNEDTINFFFPIFFLLLIYL